jgi:hypothetical protein
MANLWKRIVKQQMIEEHENDPKYQWETYAKVGWHKREQVAEALDCHEGKVQCVLRSAITSKKIERRDIPIWCKLNKELIKVVAYREKGTEKESRKPETGSLNPETGKRKRGRPRKGESRKKPKPQVGMTVRSRLRGNLGKIAEISRGRMRVEWDSGKVTQPAVEAVARGDIYLEF